MHGLFAGNLLCILQQSISSADLIEQVVIAVFNKHVTSFTFVTNHRGHDGTDMLHQRLFGFAECDLIANLIEVSHGLRAFPVQASDGEVDFLQAIKNLVNLSRDYECRKMQHNANTHAGSNIGGASGQVTKVWVERVVQLLLDVVIDGVNLLPGFVEV